jgi:hypothetical protein
MTADPTHGLVPLADLPCLLSRSRAHVDRWLAWGILQPVVVQGNSYVARRQVDDLRDPVRALRAEVDAAEAQGVPWITPEALALVVRVVSDALSHARQPQGYGRAS